MNIQKPINYIEYLKIWDVDTDEINLVLNRNPSLRGMVFGYIGEVKVTKIFASDPRILNIYKPDDHDRKEKADLVFTYKGVQIKVEVKSLQTNSIKHIDQKQTAVFQCDASDRRIITFPSGETVNTTCLLAGEFDLLAVNLFAFQNKWIFAFAKNTDLPRSNYAKYLPEARKLLLASNMKITWPLENPYVNDPFSLLDEIVKEKANLDSKSASS